MAAAPGLISTMFSWTHPQTKVTRKRAVRFFMRAIGVESSRHVNRKLPKRLGIPIVDFDGGLRLAQPVGRVDPAILDSGKMTPASGALGLVRTDRRRARKAPDGGETHGV